MPFPLVSSGDGPKGESDEKEKVSDGQVQQEHVGHGLHSCAVPVDEDDEAVAHGTHEERQPVQRWEEVACKLPDIVFLTEEIRDAEVLIVICESCGIVVVVIGQVRDKILQGDTKQH